MIGGLYHGYPRVFPNIHLSVSIYHVYSFVTGFHLCRGADHVPQLSIPQTLMEIASLPGIFNPTTTFAQSTQYKEKNQVENHIFLDLF